MACTSLLTYIKNCGTGISAGTSKLYMIAYQDLQNIASTTSTYSVSAGGLISAIGLKTTKKFVEIGINKNTVGIKESIKKDASKGTFEITSELELVITNMTPEARVFVDAVMAQPIAILVKLKSGVFIAAGLNGFMEVETIEAGSGIAGTDLNGYTIKFSGVEDELLRTVDGTIISTIV